MKSLLVLTLTLSAIGICRPSFSAQPNIILLMGDDHGWEETGYNGHPHVKTPVLDEMAATGLKLENFYAGHPTCSPTRASFLTGRHPNRMGTFAPGWSFRPEEITSAHILGVAGYRCAHFGKWHLGAVKAASPVNPGAMGFDEWISHDNFFELNPSLSRNGAPPGVIQGESSEILIRETIRFIDHTRKKDKPFFTVVWFGSPHEPYSGLPADLALYDDLPAKYKEKKVRLTSNETGSQTTRLQGDVLRERYAEITAMDRAIGTLRKHLAAEGLRDNTLLFYCGDNGTSRDGSLVTPHRGVKGQFYDGGILVPGLIEWPARIPKPRSTKIRASTTDLLPTLCAIVGQPLPTRPIDGIDLTPLLDGSMTERSNPLFFWGYNTRGAGNANAEPYIDPELQEGTTPLVKFSAGKATRDFKNFVHPAVIDSDYLGPRTIIDGDMKLVIHEQKSGEATRELFDLQTDPAEENNLIDQEPATAKKLQTRLRQWQQSVLNSLTGADYAKGKPAAKKAAAYDASVPKPTFSEVRYGPHERHIVDFWKAESDSPTPLAFIIHGGGWQGGSKERVNRFADVATLLEAGISVAAFNYRYIVQAVEEGIEPPVKAPLHDAARALQFVRSKAAEWNIDKERVGAAGGSAGACSSVWLAFHDDLADPKNADPIARESSRLWCAAVTGAQTTLDPQQMVEWTPNSRYGGHAFGLRNFAEFLAGREKILPWIAEYSPYALVTADDPPVYLIYSVPPALGQDQKDPTHTSNFGVKLQEHCAATGVACELVYPGAPGVKHETPTAYLIATLKAPAGAARK